MLQYLYIEYTLLLEHELESIYIPIKKKLELIKQRICERKIIMQGHNIYNSIRSV